MSSVCQPRDHSVNSEACEEEKKKAGGGAARRRGSFPKSESKNQRQRDALTEGKGKPVRESEGERERGQIYQTISRSHIKEKAHLKQQALWGITHSSAPLSHQAQSEHENLQHTQTKHHTAATVGC